MKTKVILIAFLFAFFNLSAQEEWKNKLEKKEYINKKSSLPYRIYIPEITNNEKVSLVLFLHGAGERGADNEKQLTHGIKYFMSDTVCNEFKFIFVAPQCPETARWVEASWTAPSHKMPHISVPLELTFEILDSLINTYNIDTNRIYVSGISMGGFGTWDAMQRRPNFFAAGMPICGGGDDSKAGLLTNIPIKAFHGKLDQLVIPARTINMANNIKLNGGNLIEITIFPNLGHLCWDKVYSNPDNIRWLLSQQKNEK